FPQLVILKVAGAKEQRTAVFQQVISIDMIIQVIQQDLILRIEAGVNAGIFYPMPAQKHDPVDAAKRYGVRLQSFAVVFDLINKIVNKLQALLFSYVGLLQIVKIVEVVSPEFTVLVVIPVNTISKSVGLI